MKGTVHRISIKPETPGERGLPKAAVETAIALKGGLRGDFNRYRHEEMHDDSEAALVLLPVETIRDLNREGWPVRAGDLGENITTEGFPYTSFAPGKVYAIGHAVIEITRACDPCTNLYLLPYVGEKRGPAFLKTMVGRRGWYAKTVREGSLRMGDSIKELEAARPASGAPA